MKVVELYGQRYVDLEITPPPVAWQMLRALRHVPPGNAAKGDRKATFNAALEQAEQFFTGAMVAGTATRPVLVFYGLAQAGWAVAAADTNTDNNHWRMPGGHGITTAPVQNAVNGKLADFALVDDGRGSFTTLATVLSAASLPAATPLGQLWGLLAEDQRFALPGMGTARPLAVSGMGGTGAALVTIGALPAHLLTSSAGDDSTLQALAWAEQRRQVVQYLAQYPDLAGCASSLPEGRPLTITGNSGDAFEIQVRLESGEGAPELSSSDAIVPTTIGYRGQRGYVFPQVGGSQRPAHPFLLWWAVCFGLSKLARYEPKGWAERISVNTSADAIPIEHLLDRALVVLPELIHRTILRVADDE